MREDELVKIMITFIQTPKSQPHKNKKNGYKYHEETALAILMTVNTRLDLWIQIYKKVYLLRIKNKYTNIWSRNFSWKKPS